MGRTDESLTQESLETLGKEAKKIRELAGKPAAIITSPMKRCLETAETLFPEHDYPQVPRVRVEDLSECDFGEFENKNYKELSGNQNYQRWIDSNGTLPFPGGESREQFIRRSMEGFDRMMSDILKRSEKNTGIQNDTDPRYLNSDRGTEIPVVTIVHGGTIMAVLSSLTGVEYFDFQVKNGEGYETVLEWIQGSWKITSLTKIGCEDSKSEHLQ